MIIKDFNTEMVNRLHHLGVVIKGQWSDYYDKKIEDSFNNKIDVVRPFTSDNTIANTIYIIFMDEDANKIKTTILTKSVSRLEIHSVLFQIGFYKTAISDMIARSNYAMRGKNDIPSVAWLFDELIQEMIESNDAEGLRNLLYCDIDSLIKEYNDSKGSEIYVWVHLVRVFDEETKHFRMGVEESWMDFVKSRFDWWFNYSENYDSIECKVALLSYKRDKLGYNDPRVDAMMLGL